MKIQYHLAALLLATSLFTACTKKPNEDTDNGNKPAINCKVSKVFMYGEAGSTTFIDTVTYTYTGDHITKLTMPDGYVTFDYDNGRIIQRNYFDSLTATQSTDYETVAYNSNGSIAKIEWYSEGGTELENRYEFAYNAGKLVKFTSTWYMDGASDDDVKTHFYTYTGGNITRDSVVESGPYETENSIYHYTYDAQPNHLQKGGTNTLLHSPLFFEFDGGMLPFLFSANNLTGARESDDDEEMKFGYTTDANGNLSLIKVEGMPAIMWQYQCP
jgi:hypothetical protein